MNRQIVNSPYLQRVLLRHQYQARSNDCGPFSVAMAINAITGLSLDGSMVAKALNRPRLAGPFPVVRRIPNWATFPWGLTDIARQYRVNARWRPFTPYMHMIRSLQAGILPLVIIGGWKPAWAHFMVLLAYNPERGLGFADPATQASELHWFPEMTFYKQWGAFGRMVVFLSPPNR